MSIKETRKIVKNMLMIFVFMFLFVILSKNVNSSSVAYFKFDYPPYPETFIIKLDDPTRIQEARDILAGKIMDRIHVAGKIIKEPAIYNPPWSYQLNSSSIVFFQYSIEVCDSNIKYIEENLNQVGGSFLPGNFWCPWGSRLLEEVNDTIPPEITLASPQNITYLKIN